MTDITDMLTWRFIPIMFTSRFSNNGRRNRVLDERHRLMNRDIFINQSTYVVGSHDVELQDGCWCGASLQEGRSPQEQLHWVIHQHA